MKYAPFAKSSALAGFLLFLLACGNQPKDPAAQLAKLKEQKAQIEAQITQLEKEAGVGAAEQRIRTVGLTELKPQIFRHFIDLQGKIEAEESVQATAKMPGALTRVLVKNGDAVRKGQLLAQIDDQIMQKSKAELELQLATATEVFNRQKSLWDQKIGTEIQFIQARTQKEALEKSLETLTEQMNMTNIYAPIDGVVDVVILKTGQAIAPGVPLCNILNLRDLKITGKVPDAYSAKVRTGDQVVVYFPDLDKEITTRISYVSRSIDPMSRTFAVEAKLPSQSDYRANMIAVLKIIDYQRADAIVAPINVVQNAEDGEFVILAEKTGDNKATARKTLIKTGVNYGGMVEITQGLKKGDWLISTGYQEVNNGETIGF